MMCARMGREYVHEYHSNEGKDGCTQRHVPEPMLKDGFRSFAVTGKPVEAHLSVQRLVIVRQREPVDEGEVDEPHVCGAKFFQENFPKEEKVTSVLHVGTSFQYGLEDADFKELHAKRVRRAQSSSKVIRSVGPIRCGRSHRSVCTIPKTRCTSAACCGRSGVPLNFTLVATGWHGLKARPSEGVCAACVSFRRAGPSRRSAKTQTRDVRRAGTWQKVCRRPTRMSARKRS